MFASLRRCASFANVCSLLALTIVLSTGTAYAVNTVRSKDIVNGQVKMVDLGRNAVDSTKVADNSLTADDLGTGSVNSNELATDSVNETEIADSSIDSGEIVDHSVGSIELGDGAVGTTQVADGSLTGSDIASDTISTSDLVGTDQNGSISLSSGAVAQGRCNSYSIGVPGAVANQTVMISARAGLAAGVILYGVRVPSTGTVTMAVCNFTGGTFPPLSSFPIRTVTFG